MLSAKPEPASGGPGGAAPLVSVLLPVYNGSSYLKEAIESILNQSYAGFELIIINDGSKDNSVSIIEQFDDPRIRFYSQANMGLAATLNRGIGLAKGAYLARQDQDDLSLPTRLEKQVHFLDTHPECGIVGSWASIYVEGSRSRLSFRHPGDNVMLQFRLLFNNPFVHSSMMIRKAVFREVGIYCTDKSRQPPEDYELWSRVARKFSVANIPEVLNIYRETSSSMSRTGVNPFLAKVVAISAENLALLMGKEGPGQDLKNLSALYNGAYDKVSAPLNLRALSSLVFQAARRLDPGMSPRLYTKGVFPCMAKLYCRYLLYLSQMLKRARANHSSEGV